MPPHKDKAIVACAGSGKTTGIVRDALALGEQRTLIVTYTNENVDQIKNCFIAEHGSIPSNVTVFSWYSFLLQHCVRPYHNYVAEGRSIRSIYYFKPTDQALLRRLRFIRETDIRHYLTASNLLYEDKVSRFALKCNQRSGGLVVNRLEKVFEHIFFDEAQDFEGWDYELIGALLQSSIPITIVGDPRQKILKTHRSNKNRNFPTIYDWMNANYAGRFDLENSSSSRRCNQPICDFADALFPDLANCTSENAVKTDHDGVFFIQEDEVDDYMKAHKPIVLRHNKRSNTLGYPAINIGLAKGRTYSRVLIFPTGPMLKYLKSGSLDDAGDVCRFYVAVTRARYSVAFVVDRRFVFFGNRE